MVGLAGIRAPLFVPANQPQRFAKAAASGADAVILDLEDAVASAEKDKARDALEITFTDLPIIVRINARGTPWHDVDIEAVRRLRPSAVMLPKAEDPEALVEVTRGTAGLPVFALIETARGLTQARAIAAQPETARLAFGSVDYCADLGCAHERDVLLAARSELVLAARLASGAAPLDGVTTDVSDPDKAHDDALHARALGITGKLCIHPRQVGPVIMAFAPNATQIDWARRVLASGDGAVSVDGQMVDEPVRRRAKALLTAAEQG